MAYTPKRLNIPLYRPGHLHRRLPVLPARAALLDVRDFHQAERPTIWPCRQSGSRQNRPIVHYVAALFDYRGLQGLINSLIISISATILSALFGTLMAYSLARFNTGGKHLSFWVLSQRFLPPVAIILPIFLIYRSIGLL